MTLEQALRLLELHWPNWSNELIEPIQKTLAANRVDTVEFFAELHKLRTQLEGKNAD
jgi:hypothetical protein